MRASWEDRVDEIDRIILIRAKEGKILTPEDKEYIIQLSEFALIAVQSEMIRQ